MNENNEKHELNEQISNYSIEEAELCQYPERKVDEVEKQESDYAFKWEYVEAEAKANEKRSNTWVYLLVMGISFVVTFSILTFVLRDFKSTPSPSPLPPSGAEAEAPNENSSKTIYIKEYDPSSGLLTPQEIYSLASPSVVSIRVRGEGVSGIGSGFVFASGGYIATAAHVISGMEEITVITKSGEEFSAELISSDELTDLALLKIEGNSLAPLEHGSSSELLVGDKVYAIGTPASLEFAGSMTAGDISFVDRRVSIYNESDGSLKKKMTLIQTSAALNPGNSGGPVLDSYGRVVGIVTMKLGNSFDGISFVIPSDEAYKILTDMKNGIELDDTRRAPIATYAARLGIKGESFSNEKHLGVNILGFYSDDCDASKKLKVGDVIVSLNGNPISGITALSNELSKYSPGEIVSVTVLRSEQLLTFGIILTR